MNLVHSICRAGRTLEDVRPHVLPRHLLRSLLAAVSVLVVATSCSGGSSGDAGGTQCGHPGEPCCAGQVCATGNACENAVCAQLDASVAADAGGSGPGEAGYESGHPGSGDAGACGNLGEACCPASGCTAPLTCRNGACQNAPSNGTGTPCGKNSDCPSGICQPVGKGGNVCSTACTTESDCVPGWMCAPELGQSTSVCQCTSSPEICDGKDNDCDGVVDNEPATDQWCMATPPSGTGGGGFTGGGTSGGPIPVGGSGGTCVTVVFPRLPSPPGQFYCSGGQCACKTSCGGQCVDEQTDPNNCGACGTMCPGGGTCASGVCSCGGTEIVCKGECTNTASDSCNCGMCGIECPMGASCQTGSCTCPMGESPSSGMCCPTGQANCSGSCVNEQTDNNNCGGCGTTCAANEKCLKGQCYGTVEFTPGSQSFVVPAGVTSISVVVIGGGGSGSVPGGAAGGGGALCYSNGIAVVPGTSIPVVVGGSGGDSSFNGSLIAHGGSSASGGAAGSGGTGTGGTCFSGGRGGTAFKAGCSWGGGGGGAAGYTGNGGAGGNGGYSGTPGTGDGAPGGPGGMNCPSDGEGNMGSGTGDTGTGIPMVPFGGGGGGFYTLNAMACPICPGEPGSVRVIWGPGASFPAGLP